MTALCGRWGVDARAGVGYASRAAVALGSVASHEELCAALRQKAHFLVRTRVRRALRRLGEVVYQSFEFFHAGWAANAALACFPSAL